MEQKKILVIGYYHRDNLGDQAFITIFTQYFKGYHLDFRCSDDLKTTNLELDQYKCLIVGGGDLVNDYFFNNVRPLLANFSGIKIGLSLGIPFPSLITSNNFGHFDHVFTRNYEDVRALQAVMGSERAHYLPDFTFMLDRPSKPTNPSDMASPSPSTLQSPLPKTKGKIGVFLINNLSSYPAIMSELQFFLHRLSKSYTLVFYRFNSSGGEEDDGFINHKMVEKINTGRSVPAICDTKIYDAQEMIEEMSTLEFAICLRFHAHIFAMLAGVPLMSISSTRKTRSLMKRSRLTDYQYEIGLNGYGTPVSADWMAMYRVFNLLVKDRKKVMEMIEACVQRNRFELDHSKVKTIVDRHGVDLEEDLNQFLLHYQNDYDNASRIMNRSLLGSPETRFSWGIIDKLKRFRESLRESIEFLKQQTIEPLCEILDPSANYLTLRLNEYKLLQSVHRGGWYLAIEELAKRMSNHGVYCDMYLDRTFHWGRNYLEFLGVLPYTSPWVGFLHHPMRTVLSEYNTENLIKQKLFLQSLPTCRCLFTLNEHFTKELRSALLGKGYETPIYTLDHPVVTPDHIFDLERFSSKADHHKMLVQVGSWQRNLFTIHTLVDVPMQKAVLLGSDVQENRFPPKLKIKVQRVARQKNVETKTAATPTKLTDNSLVKTIELTSPSHDEGTNPKQDLVDGVGIDVAVAVAGKKDVDGDLACQGETLETPRIILFFIEWLSKRNAILDWSYNRDENLLTLTAEPEAVLDEKELDDMINSVQYMERLNNEKYDQLLSENIVFLHLESSAASNVIIECIVRNTPLLINRMPETVELLGDKYPLFYREESLLKKGGSVGDLLTSENIRRANEYLSKLDKKKYDIEYFVKSFSNQVKILAKI